MKIIPIIICLLPPFHIRTLAADVNLPKADADTLKSSSVTSSRVIHHPDKDTYIILQKNVNTAADVFNLIVQIPGAQYNSIDKTLKINGSEAITYTLDGIDASENELAALTPDMVKSISIVHTPKGKYISNGIRYVVEIKKKKETGILLNLENIVRDTRNVLYINTIKQHASRQRNNTGTKSIF